MLFYTPISFLLGNGQGLFDFTLFSCRLMVFRCLRQWNLRVGNGLGDHLDDIQVSLFGAIRSLQYSVYLLSILGAQILLKSDQCYGLLFPEKYTYNCAFIPRGAGGRVVVHGSQFNNADYARKFHILVCQDAGLSEIVIPSPTSYPLGTSMTGTPHARATEICLHQCIRQTAMIKHRHCSQPAFTQCRNSFCITLIDGHLASRDRMLFCYQKM